MKNTRRFTAFFLAVIMIAGLFPTTKIIANADNTAWKQHLKDFLSNSFPSLFNENIAKKNWNLAGNGFITDKNSLSQFSKDIVIYDSSEEAGGKELWVGYTPYSYHFYDFDGDSIPEIVIFYGAMLDSGGDNGWKLIYKYNNSSYEKIERLHAMADFYVNSQNKFVLVNYEWACISSINFAEIKNNKLVLTDYIDSKGSKTFKGASYNSLDEVSEIYFKEVSEEIATLKPFPEFDCSDVINSIKNGTPLTTTPVNNDSWSKADIDRARALGLLPASLDGDYQQIITRAEFCVLAVPLYEKIKGEKINPDKGYAEPTPSRDGRRFTDIEKLSAEKQLAINKMASIQVVEGNNRLFNPNNFITRQEAAVMLSRLIDTVSFTPLFIGSTFKDIDKAADWAREHIGKVEVAGVMNGIENTLGEINFNPNGLYTREQAIITMMRIWDSIENDLFPHSYNCVKIPTDGGFWTDTHYGHKIFLSMQQAEELFSIVENTRKALSEVTADVINDILDGVSDVIELKAIMLGIDGVQGVPLEIQVGTAKSEFDIVDTIFRNLSKEFISGLSLAGYSTLSSLMSKILLRYIIISTGLRVSNTLLEAYHTNGDIDSFAKALENSKGKIGFIILNLRDDEPLYYGFKAEHYESEWINLIPYTFINYMREYAHDNRGNFPPSYLNNLLKDVEDGGIVSFKHIPDYFVEKIEHCLFHIY